MKGVIMKDEYDFSKAKRVDPKRIDPDAIKIPTSLRLDASDVSKIRDEADRLGIPYQTLIGSIIHRYVNGQLLDKKDVELFKVG
jgi:predicted DNA binding CopG/RHH family protein